MSRRPKSKNTGPEMGEQRPWPAFTDADAAEVMLVVDQLHRRVKRGQRPPAYLLSALRRFASTERDRLDRILARNEVARIAEEEGLPLSRSSKGGETAFDRVAARLRRSAAWVEDAYYRPTPRK